MPTLSDILYEFSALSGLQKKKQKAAYLDRLKECYKADTHQTTLTLPVTATGLGDIGAQLIGEFLQCYAGFKVINLPAHHFYNPIMQNTPEKNSSPINILMFFFVAWLPPKNIANWNI